MMQNGIFNHILKIKSRRWSKNFSNFFYCFCLEILYKFYPDPDLNEKWDPDRNQNGSDPAHRFLSGLVTLVPVWCSFDQLYLSQADLSDGLVANRDTTLLRQQYPVRYFLLNIEKLPKNHHKKTSLEQHPSMNFSKLIDYNFPCSPVAGFGSGVE